MVKRYTALGDLSTGDAEDFLLADMDRLVVLASEYDKLAAAFLDLYPATEPDSAAAELCREYIEKFGLRDAPSLSEQK